MPKGKGNRRQPQQLAKALEKIVSKTLDKTGEQIVRKLSELEPLLKKDEARARQLSLFKDVIELIDSINEEAKLAPFVRQQAGKSVVYVLLGNLAYFYDLLDKTKKELQTADESTTPKLEKLFLTYDEKFVSLLRFLPKQSVQSVIEALEPEMQDKFWEDVTFFIQNYSAIHVVESEDLRWALPPVQRKWSASPVEVRLTYEVARLKMLEAEELSGGLESVISLLHEKLQKTEQETGSKKLAYASADYAWMQGIYQEILITFQEIADNFFPYGSTIFKANFICIPAFYRHASLMIKAKEQIKIIEEASSPLDDISLQHHREYMAWDDAFRTYCARYDHYLKEVVKELVDQEKKRTEAVEKRFGQLVAEEKETYAKVPEESDTPTSPTPVDPLLPYKQQRKEAIELIRHNRSQEAMLLFSKLKQQILEAEQHSEGLQEKEKAALAALRGEVSLGCVEAFLSDVRPVIEGLLKLRKALKGSLESEKGLRKLERRVKQGLELLLVFPAVVQGLENSVPYVEDALKVAPEELSEWLGETINSLKLNIDLIGGIKEDFLLWEKRHREWKTKQGKYIPNTGEKVTIPPSMETQYRWQMQDPIQAERITVLADVIASFPKVKKVTNPKVKEGKEEIVSDRRGREERRAAPQSLAFSNTEQKEPATYRDKLLTGLSELKAKVPAEGKIAALTPARIRTSLTDDEREVLERRVKELKSKKLSLPEINAFLHTLSLYQETYKESKGVLEAMTKETSLLKQQASYYRLIQLAKEMGEKQAQQKTLTLDSVIALEQRYVTPISHLLADARYYPGTLAERQQPLFQVKLEEVRDQIANLASSAQIFRQDVNNAKHQEKGNREEFAESINRLIESQLTIAAMLPKEIASKNAKEAVLINQ